MSILRIHKKQNNFVILDKTCLYQKTLSWAAKGLHAYLISMPDDWRVQVKHLQNESRGGRDAVRSILKELEQAGYIQRSASRNNSTGRFGGIEYFVFEVPQPFNNDFTPGPEKASSDENPSEMPETGIPESGNPSPANPTLLNNKNNKYQEINNKAVAGINAFTEETEYQSNEKNLAAAPFFEAQQNALPKTADIRPFHATSQKDALIGEILTENQKSRIRMLAEHLAGTDPFSFPTANQLETEITFCMTSKNHFRACKEDFTYKLNAMKAVIARGDWQSPAELIYEVVSTEHKQINRLQQDLNAAIAEVIHFEKLMNSASQSTREGLSELVIKARNKVETLQQQLHQTNHEKQA